MFVTSWFSEEHTGNFVKVVGFRDTFTVPSGRADLSQTYVVLHKNKSGAPHVAENTKVSREGIFALTALNQFEEPETVQ